MLISVIFICWKIVHMDINYSEILTISGIINITVVSFIYGILLILMSSSWWQIVSVISGKTVRFRLAAKIYCKSNLLKYIPGNVFQYVGRNELADKVKVSHADVAMATGVDIVLQTLSFFLVSILFCGYGLIKVVRESVFLQLFLPLGIFGAIVIIFIVIKIYGRKHKEKLDYYRSLVSKKNMGVLLKCILCYSLMAIMFGLIYLYIVCNMQNIHLQFNQYIQVFGTFILSWLFGYITPGAPGGIGIREMVLTILLGSTFDISPFLAAIVIYRFINTFGDIFAYLITLVVECRLQRRKEK